MNKAEAKLVLLNDKIPYSQRCLWNKLKRPGIYARRKSATFRCLNERGPRESRWFSTIMVYAKKIQTSYLLNEPLFTILAPSSNRLTNDNKIRKIRYTNERERERKRNVLFIRNIFHLLYIITGSFEATKYYLIYLTLAIFPGKTQRFDALIRVLKVLIILTPVHYRSRNAISRNAV